MKIYRNNIARYNGSIIYLDKVLNRLSVLRALSFVGSLVLIIFLANERLTTFLWVATPLCVIGFVFLLLRYNKANHLKETSSSLKKINEDELLKLENNLESFPDGSSYRREGHAYAADLDVFGSHSLFQLLNRTTTESGNACLARWLSEPASKEIILDRQRAIQELIPNVDWRQQLQAVGLPFQNLESDYQKLLNWVEKPEQLLPKQNWYLFGSITLAISSTVFCSLYVANSLADSWNFYLVPLLFILLVNRVILKKIAPVAEEIIDGTHQNVKILAGYQRLVETILSENFQSKKLKELQSYLLQNESSAATEIGRLKKILETFQLRGTKKYGGHKFYPLFNTFWLFDIYWIILSERWKSRNRKHIHHWIHSISEFEALNSLAGFSYSNPEFTFPEIKEAPYIINFEMLGHPLIKSDTRVCNNFQLQGFGKIAMITGSNMAGKSTFLRTVGVNLILALMGAPCCARSAQVSHMNMFTSMRTQDNLEEGVSSFYAELKRVEQLLALIKTGQPIFFMLDEMFKGTNSQDRYKGGVSLIKQLSELNAFGLISTHDLELAELAGKHMIVSNHSFNSKIQSGEMTFSYQLVNGICTDFNASELMKKSGIKMLSNIEVGLGR